MAQKTILTGVITGEAHSNDLNREDIVNDYFRVAFDGCFSSIAVHPDSGEMLPDLSIDDDSHRRFFHGKEVDFSRERTADPSVVFMFTRAVLSKDLAKEVGIDEFAVSEAKKDGEHIAVAIEVEHKPYERGPDEMAVAGICRLPTDDTKGEARYLRFSRMLG